MSYKITLTQASQYISDLLNVSSLESIARNNSMGGTFGSPSLPTTSGKGLMFWFNLEDKGSSVYEFYTTHQIYPDPGTQSKDRLPVGGNQLYKPDESFVYTPLGTNVNDVSTFLLAQNTGTTPSSSTITQQEVKDNVKDFLGNFPKDGNGYPFNDRAHCFFTAEDLVGDFDDLLSQSGAAGLRYFVGLDTSSNPDPINRLRLIFCAVDNRGENLLSGPAPLVLQRGQPR